MKEIFQSIFIEILLAEFAFIIFNLVYPKLIDPLFWDNLGKDLTDILSR